MKEIVNRFLFLTFLCKLFINKKLNDMFHRFMSVICIQLKISSKLIDIKK